MINNKIIIGRSYEIEKLEKAYQSPKAEFIAVYGRRRIGKTYLIRNFFSQKSCDYFQITGIHKAKAKDQLKEFINEVQRCFLPDYTKLDVPTNWMDAFKILTRVLEERKSKKKVVLFFDELPWMAIRSSKLLQALEYYWNRFWVDMPNLKLVICGSASSWIISNIIQNKGGLHNRVTLRLPMDPFNLSETKAYLDYTGVKYDFYQSLQIYLCLGGIPYYLSMLDKGYSAIQNINRTCFQKKGSLYDEFDVLFASLFNDSSAYEHLITVISRKRNGVSRKEIEEMVQYKGGALSKRLKDLEQLGFIRSFTLWDRSKKGIYYKIIDEYTLFYLTWISPASKQKLIGGLTNEYWEEISQTQAWKSWAGYAFEAVCFKHIPQIRKALHISDGAVAYSWKYVPLKPSEEDDGAQIDLVFDRLDHTINIVEIKYSNSPYVLNKDDAQNLMKKVNIYKKVTKTEKLIFISMITTFGLKPSPHSNNLISSVATMEDLFNT